MSIVPRLELRVGQALVMTPQLRQAIRLLQLNAQELTGEIAEALAENPFLVEVDAEGGTAVPAEGPPASGAAPNLADAPADGPADSVQILDGTSGSAREDDPLNPATVWDEAEDWRAGGGLGEGALGLGHGVGAGGDSSFDEDGLDDPLLRIADRPSLRDHLGAQAMLELRDPVDQALAYALIDGLDPDGYWRGEPAMLAATLGVTSARVLQVLARVQRFDPVGIAARDLAECLRLQLDEQGMLTWAHGALLAHLHLAEKRDRRPLAAALGLDVDEVEALLADLRRLDPRPGLAFAAVQPETLVPDLLLSRRGDGSLDVELNPEAHTALALDRLGVDRARAACRDREGRAWISDKAAAAAWFVRAVEQRAHTLVRVGGEIVRRQEGFFLHGVTALRPLVLKQIAELVELHESTISRVTRGKYLATPRGVFELKFFFSNAVKATEGMAEGVAAEAARARVKALIAAEPPARPLSDDALQRLLHEEGIALARRTVAKYRDQLGIPSSAERRRG